MKRFLALLVVMALACGHDPTGPEPMPSLTGTWALQATVSDSILTCNEIALMNLVQTDSIVTGVAHDWIENCGVYDNGMIPDFDVAGHISQDKSLSLQLTYHQVAIVLQTGTLTDAKHMSGTMTGQFFLASGPWSATRQ